MKKFLIIGSIIATLLGIILVIFLILANYNWSNNFLSYWNLADKSSTIDAKSGYIDQFVKKIEDGKFSDYNAIFLKTPDNNFEKNFTALKTLQGRLQEIKTMDIESFAYQQAIQQITAQEQGEAQDMLLQLKGCWMLRNYLLLWGWISEIFVILITGWFLFIVIYFIINF